MTIRDTETFTDRDAFHARLQELVKTFGPARDVLMGAGHTTVTWSARKNHITVIYKF